MSQMHPLALVALVIATFSAIVGTATLAVPRLLPADELSAPRVEEEIESWAVSRRGLNLSDARVRCPSGIEVEAGRTFSCLLRAPGMGTLGVDVTIENDDGYLTWRLSG